MPRNSDGDRNQLTSFVGRETELREVAQRLHDPGCRLLTLLGPGGAGKSRLARELVRREEGLFADGIFWMDLDSVQTEDALVRALAYTLSLSLADRNTARQHLLAFLEDKQMLFVLDNFEQLVAGAHLLDEMLRRANGVKLVVTSRIALHLTEEWLYPLSGLPYPVGSGQATEWRELESYDAVRLFVDRVCQVRPDFVPQEEQAGLLRICQLVEGMPLALELAAAWARSLDCATIASEIEHNRTFLSTPLRNVPRRQRSMQAVFNHSWSLLDPDEQRVFRRMALFRGGFDREAAEVIAEATLVELRALVDKSLLRWDGGRYQIHGLLRQYAETQLVRLDEEAGESRVRHAKYYLDFVAQREGAFLGQGQQQAADEVLLELENIQDAWRRAVEEQMVEDIGRAIEGLAMFFHIKGRYLEAASLYEEALSGLTLPDEPGAALLYSEAGWIAIRLGQFERAATLFERCQEVYERLYLDPMPGQGTDPRLGLSTLASIAGDYVRAEALAHEAWRRARKQEHFSNLQTANYQLASIAYARGDYQAARSRAEAAYDACRQTGDKWFMGYCLSELGRAEQALGDLEAARTHFGASYELRETFSDPEGMALALKNLAEVALRQGELEEAQSLFERSASTYRTMVMGDKGGWAAVQSGLGQVATAQGRHEQARDHFQGALAVAAGIQYTPLILSTLAAVATFLAETGRPEAGARLMTLVHEHPATDQETKVLVQRQLSQISGATVVEKSFAPDLATAVAWVRQELNVSVEPTSSVNTPRAAATGLVEVLTERELEVLQLLAEGLTNREIAERLVVVTGTVKAHNNHIFGKLGVRNRTQAVARARELGLI